MSLMSPILKTMESFQVIGLSTRTQNSEEFNEKTAKIPALWQSFQGCPLALADAPVFAVYSDYARDEKGPYTLTLGIVSDKPREDYNVVTVQKGNYLLFQGKGPMPATVLGLWQSIWEHFASNSVYQRNFVSDFESYLGLDEVAIYIGVD